MKRCKSYPLALMPNQKSQIKYSIPNLIAMVFPLLLLIHQMEQTSNVNNYKLKKKEVHFKSYNLPHFLIEVSNCKLFS